MNAEPKQAAAFSEKDFYLAEFRGRTLGIAAARWEPSMLGRAGAVAAVLAELSANRTRVVLVGWETASLESLVGDVVVGIDDPGWIGRLWRILRSRGRAGLSVSPTRGLAAATAAAALRLGLAKLVWLDPAGGLCQPDGGRVSSADLAGLDRLIADPAIAAAVAPETRELLPELRSLLASGFPSVAICRPEGLADELFRYEGSGTVFTRDRYTGVRRLALDEFDAACDLIDRGVAEGYLVPRSGDQLEAVLANGFGVFVEGRYLAGVGALLPHPAERAGEIASLYTLTRFIGEGVGGYLVRFALREAQRRGCAYVFACTTAPRVERFFERFGFRVVDPGQVPKAKWRDYAPERRAGVHCLRHDLPV